MMTKAQLIEAIKLLPDDAEIRVQTSHWEVYIDGTRVPHMNTQVIETVESMPTSTGGCMVLCGRKLAD
jgi:uncharacterized protein YlzI (FlbEa/FlbD family)